MAKCEALTGSAVKGLTVMCDWRCKLRMQETSSQLLQLFGICCVLAS